MFEGGEGVVGEKKRDKVMMMVGGDRRMGDE